MSQYPIFAQNRVVIDSENINIFGFDNTTFTYNGQEIMGQGTNLSLGAVGSTPNADAATLVGGVLELQPANATHPGVLVSSNVAQTLGGNYTFTNNINAPNLSGTNTGDLTLTGIGLAPNGSGAFLSGQVLTMEPADATHPGLIVGSGVAQNLGGTYTFTNDVTMGTNRLNANNGSAVLLAPVVSSSITNIFVGDAAGNATLTGLQNAGFGSTSLQDVTSGTRNTGCGFSSLDHVTSGTDLIGIGDNAGSTYTTETNNIAIGHVGQSGDTGIIRIGTTQTQSFFQSAIDISPPAQNIFTFGGYDGEDDGGFLSKFGQDLSSLTYGYNAGFGWANSVRSCAFGQNSVSGDGSDNTGFGYLALGTTGEGAGTCTGNTAIGSQAGVNITNTDSNNVCISNLGVTGDNGVIRIGTSGTQNSCFVSGISGVTVAGAVPVVIGASGQMGTTVSTKRMKRDFKEISQPSAKRIHLIKPYEFKYIEDNTNEIQYGVMVEETDEVMPELSVKNSDGVLSAFQYHKLTPLLLAAVQDQEKRLLALEAKLK
jgi:Chaperone of endosialidase